MKVAVTGATGFVGKSALRILAAAGDDAVPIVRAPSGLADEIVAGDLADARIDPGRLNGVDAVLHLAARTHVIHDTAADPLAAYRATNLAGTRAVLDAAVAADVKRFVYMSSVKAVGERTAPGAPLTPDTPPAPEDAYGITKLEAEQEVRARCSAAGIEWAIIRSPLVYGAHAPGNLKRLVGLVAKGIPLPLGAVRNRRSFVFVDNLADAAVRACFAPGAANRILTIADITLSTPALLRLIADTLGTPLRLASVPVALLRLAGRLSGRSAEVERLCGSLEIDAESSMAALGWRPPHAADEAMAATILSYRGRNEEEGSPNG